MKSSLGHVQTEAVRLTEEAEGHSQTLRLLNTERCAQGCSTVAAHRPAWDPQHNTRVHGELTVL